MTRLLACALGLVLMTGAAVQTDSSYQAPLGIPAPPFGIAESAPPRPNPWIQSTPKFYYVDQSVGDDQVGNGTPAAPRRTIPPTGVPAGSVIEVHGTYTLPHYWTQGGPLQLTGTATDPIYIRGASESERPTITGGWWVMNSSYLILENLRFASVETTRPALSWFAPSDHLVLRYSDLSGNLTHGGMTLYTATGTTGAISNSVIYDNVIHDNGDVAANFDQDVHGITVNSAANYLWVLDNEFYRNSGDGIQINASSAALQPTVHHIYVGRNRSHHNKQYGYWCKQAVDVIFSENVSYGHRPSNSSTGGGLGFQYSPQRFWAIFNRLYDNEIGIRNSDNAGGIGTHAYIVGNLIYNTHYSGLAAYPTDAFAPAAISIVGGSNVNGPVVRHIIGNTMWDVEAGINQPLTEGILDIRNNIIGDVGLGNHVFIQSATNPGPATQSTMDHNLFEGLLKLRWGNVLYRDLGQFQSAYPGKGASTITLDPRFVSVAEANFELQSTSPAVDAGQMDSVYQTFRDTYGIDIAVDLKRRLRVDGVRVDIGSFEYSAGLFFPPTNLRIIGN